MTRSCQLSVLLISLWAVLVATAAAADIQVTAKLEPTRFSEDQAARFVLTVTGAMINSPALSAWTRKLYEIEEDILPLTQEV
ncbi:MAG: hypothetical protein D3909_06255 [Candidatus Electrothrix sp. ATG1]|nr:hypothetical protein [Candidatus Electrothrix sp. ATG1]